MRLFTGRDMVAYLQDSLPKVERARELMERGRDPLFYGAPTVVVVHAEAWDTCSAFNCAVALYNCSLMAHAMGLGCCFNGYLESALNHDRRLKRILGIPENHRCYGAMTLGYPDVTYLRTVDRYPARVRRV
jgi:nitroreductase